MASEITIINWALLKLGARPILTRDDDSPQARIANRTFDQIRDDLMRDHPFNWSTKRAELAASATAPSWGFSYAYPVPADYLKILEVYNPNKYDYKVENQDGVVVIVTDLSAPLQIRYTARVTNVAIMDPLFQQGLSAKCAAEWCKPITGDTALVKSMTELSEFRIRQATSSDSQEDYPQQVGADEWILARG